MSRHGYTEYDEFDQLAFGRWKAQVVNATRGRRGQRLLRDMIDGLERMPPEARELHAIVIDDGEHACALGVVARVRGLDLQGLNPEQYEDGEWEEDIDSEWLSGQLSSRLDVAEQLAREVMYENDEAPGTPADRWAHMYGWAMRRYKGTLNPFAQSVGGCAGTAVLTGSRCGVHWHRLAPDACLTPDACPNLKPAGGCTGTGDSPLEVEQ